MTGLHYPDVLYADHEERKARRVANQAPTGAYDGREATIERVRVLPLVSADLHKRIAKGSKDYGEPLTTHNGRDALWDAYEEALDLCLYLRQAIEERNQQVATLNRQTAERVPKWDPAWGKPPNCDGLSARDIRAPHPMASEVIRDHDERLSGPEDSL